MPYIKYKCDNCGGENLTPFDKKGDTCIFICEDCGKETDRVVYYRKPERRRDGEVWKKVKE